MNIKLADRLVELRKEHKLSQEALAEKLGLSRQSISKWERAEASPDTDNLIALAEIYGITLDQLLGNDEPKTESQPKPEQTKKNLRAKQIKGKSNLKKAPLLFLGAIAVYVGTIPGAMDGIKYYVLPDFTKFSIKTVCAAMGQLFFSMSLAMGIMISYGSYVHDDVNVMESVNHIEIFDTVVALLSGFMIVPAVYIFSGEEGLKSSGVGLMFSTLPKVFADMPFGNFIGGVFFILVFLAALTSSISVLEAIVSNIIDKFAISRTKAGIGIGIFSFFLGIPSALGFGALSGITPLGMDFLTFFDYVSNSVLMPITALFTCILFGWVIGTKPIEDEVTKNGEKFSRRKIFRFMIRYAAPVCLVVILIFYSLAQFGVISV